MATIRHELKQALAHGWPVDAFPVKAISFLEVFVRHWVRTLTDSQKPFAERAVPLIRSIRIDYAMIIGASDQRITFGDIVANAVPFSSLEHIFAVFGQITGEDIKRSIAQERDPWPEITGVPAGSLIVGDIESLCRNVSALFKVRHQICHEAPNPEDLDLSNLEVLIASADELATALLWVLHRAAYPNIPKTQMEINVAAYQKWQEVDTELNTLLLHVREGYEQSGMYLELFDQTQRSWEAYRDSQVAFVEGDGTGSITPVLMHSEAESLTKERVAKLKEILENRH